jgi:hypothetical protein
MGTLHGDVLVWGHNRRNGDTPSPRIMVRMDKLQLTPLDIGTDYFLHLHSDSPLKR